MSDTYEVVLLVNAQGAVQAFQAVSASAAKTAASLTQVGSAGQSGLSKTTTAAGQAAGGLTRVSTAADSLQRAATGVLGSQLVGFLSDAAREAANSAEIQARLQASVDATGKSYDDYASALDNAIQKSMALGNDDEDTAAALATLTQQTDDAGKALDLLGTAQDLARGKGIGLAEAATIVGKVASGNTAILTRYGITVDKNADSTEALAQVSAKFAGQAQAFSKSTAGDLSRAQVSWHNFVEEVGGAAGPMQTVVGLLPGVSSGFKLVSGSVGAVSTSFKSGGTAAQALGAAMSPLGLAIGGVTVAGAAALLVWEKWTSDAQAVAASTKVATDAINQAAGANVQLGDAAKALLVSQTSLGDEASKDAQHFLDASYNVNKYILSAKQADDINGAVADSFAHVGAASQASLVGALSKAEDLFHNEKMTGDQLTGIVQGIDAAFQRAGTSRGADQLIAEITRVNQLFADGKTDPETYMKVISHLTDNVPAQIAMFDQLDQKIHDQAQALQLATDKYQPFIDAQQKSIDLATQAVTSSAAQNFVAPGLSSLYQSPSQQATNAASLEQASQDQLANDAEKRANAVMSANQAVEASAQKRAQGVQEASQKEIDAVNKTADAEIKSAEQSSHAQSLAIKLTGLGQSREANAAAQGQIHAATQAQHQQTLAAQHAADAQIAAAKDAADQQTQAAKDAADAQVSEAERAEHAQVRSAQVAANEQIRAAQASAHEQVAQAQHAEHAQDVAAQHLIDSVTAQAKAQQDATVKAAQAEHDQTIAIVTKTADQETALAKQTADRKIAELQRSTLAAQNNARDEANAALNKANQQAARDIHGGANPGKVAQQLEDAQKKAYADQEKAQNDAQNRQQRQQDAIQAQEQKRIDSINAYKEQATKQADAKLQAIQDQAQATEQARVDAATKQAEKMKQAAAQHTAQVQRATDKQTSDIERAANRSVEEAKRQASKQTAAAKVAIAKNEADQEKAIQANLQAQTDAINRHEQQTETQLARNTQRVRTEAEKNVQKVQADTAHQQNALARQTDQITRRIDDQRKKRIDDIKQATDDQTKAIEDDAKRQEAALTLAAAKADDLTAKALELHGALAKGGDGQYHFILGDADKTAIAQIQDAIKLFPPGKQLDLSAAAHVTVQADFSQFNEQIANVAGKTVASVEVAVKPYGSAANPARLPAPPVGPHALGGYVAANSRLVTMNEYGPEQVILPGGSVIVPHPASAADPAGKGWPDIHIHGDVYGMDDFEGKVQRAAMNGLARGLPAAIAARRRSLGAA